MSEDFVKPYVPMDRAVERALIARGQAGDIEARNEVVMNCSLMAWKAALRWNMNVPSRSKDFYSLAMQLLFEKFNQFDLGMGVRFSTWATSWINNAMYESRHGQHTSVISCPRRSSKKGYSGLTGHQRLLAYNVASIDHMDPKVRKALEPACNTSEVNPALMDESNKRTVAFVQFVLSMMNHRQREILERRTAGESLAVIGESLGVTKERVRQIETIAQQAFLNLAKQYDEKTLLELEQEVCWSNRFRKSLEKEKPKRRRREMSVEAELKKPKKLRVQEVLASLGKDAKTKDVRAILEPEGYKIFDADMSNARKFLWGSDATVVKKPSAAQRGFENLKKIKEHAGSYKGGLRAVKDRTNDVKSFLAFADQVGGIESLSQQLDLLLELSA